METRIVVADLGPVMAASIYVPNGGKDYAAKLKFFEALIAWAQRLTAEGRELVLCGDYNIARSEMDVHPRERKPVIGQRPEERELFEKLLGAGLVDVGRAKDPDNPGLFTWWAPWRNMRQRNIGWRLDYVLASPSIAERAEACKVLAQIGTSDHAPVVMIAAAREGFPEG
jgi:exodeoxyribonuclease-3